MSQDIVTSEVLVSAAPTDCGAGSVGNNIDAAISTRNATTPPTVGAIRTEIETVSGKLDLTLGHVNGLSGAAMVGTNDANTVVPDVAGTAPTSAEIKTALEAVGGMLQHLHEMTEDDGGVRRLTANALEEGPLGGAGASAAELVAGLKASVGWTAGGVWTLQTLLKVVVAWAGGKWQDSATPDAYDILDPDNGTTIIATVTPQETSPQKTVSFP